MTLWRMIDPFARPSLGSRGIHEANDLVAAIFNDGLTADVGVAASTKPMTLWRVMSIATSWP